MFSFFRFRSRIENPKSATCGHVEDGDERDAARLNEGPNDEGRKKRCAFYELGWTEQYPLPSGF